MLDVTVVTVGLLEENCYIAHNKESGVCVLVDPGDDHKRLIRILMDMDLKPEAILLTHGHYDHVGAVAGLCDYYDFIPVYAYAEEKIILEYTNKDKIMKNRAVPMDRVQFLSNQAILKLAGEDWRLIHTPGHTIGGACYYVASSGILFAGDTLFQGSCGRTDFPTGDMRAIVDSIQNKLMKLPDETVVFSGHGARTTIGIERRSNFIMLM